MDFDLFPLEIKFMILSHLSQDELKSKVSVVSDDWRRLARSKYLQQDIKVDGQLPLDTAIHQLTKNKRIRKMQICNFCHEDSFADFPICNNVRSVEIQRCNFGLSREIILTTFAERFPSIQKIITCGETDKDVSTAITLATMCKNLKILDLGHENSFSFRNDLDKFAYQLQKLSYRHHLLSTTDIEVLKHCRNLVELRIFNAEEMDEDYLVPLKELSQLRVLQITIANLIKSSSFVRFFSNPFPDMTTLILESCRDINTKVLKQIASNCSRLQKLCITYCGNVKDTGVKEIANKCSSLRELDLRGCYNLKGDFLFDNTFAQKNYFPHLIYFNVQGCHKMGELFLRNLSDLRINHPNIEIVHPFEDRFEINY